MYLLLASQREKTNKGYQSAWKIWFGWYSTRELDPLNSPLKFLLEYLAHQFQELWSLNVYRSAISSTFPRINGVAVGQHPLVVRLMKGTFHWRPPAPRYEATWPAHKVVSFLRNLLICR